MRVILQAKALAHRLPRRDSSGDGRALAQDGDDVVDRCVPRGPRIKADGSYASRKLSTIGPAFYYGTPKDTGLNKYRLQDPTILGVASGEVDVPFEYDPGDFALPAWQGLLEKLEIDATNDRLRFHFSTSTGYGPVVFDLWRCPS